MEEEINPAKRSRSRRKKFNHLERTFLSYDYKRKIRKAILDKALRILRLYKILQIKKPLIKTVLVVSFEIS